MIGRIVGVIVGAAIAVTGYGMLNPAPFAKYFDFNKLSLGPFAEYKTLVCWMIVAIGGAVALAALQRQAGGARKKRVAPVVFAPAEPEPVHAETAPAAPAPAAEVHAEAHHDDHAAPAAAHDDHGHDEHGHPEEAHDDHGHDVHAHDDHAPEAHGHDSHAHDDHHADHGHHDAHAAEAHEHEPAHAH